MLDTPKITTTEALTTAMIHLTIPRSEIQKVMGPGLKELQAALDALGIKATGPWFTHHLKMDPKVFDFEICLPVAAPVKATGRVKPGRAPAIKVARTVYHGGYEGLGSAWGELNEWIDAQGLTAAADLWERYLAGPESSPDPAEWRTELSKPLRG
jgi:effector-binding domain-containing protein